MKRKKPKYKGLVINLNSKYIKVKFVNIVISTFGVFDNSSMDFLEVVEDLEFDQKSKDYLVEKLMAIAITASPYVFLPKK